MRRKVLITLAAVGIAALILHGVLFGAAWVLSRLFAYYLGG